MKNPVSVAKWEELKDRSPEHALVSNTDLVVVRYDEEVSVLYGRCLHRGALMADGHVDGDNLICGVHNWDYRFDTGISEYNNDERLHKFASVVRDGDVWVDRDEVEEFERDNPVAINRGEYLGAYQATHLADEEPHTAFIDRLARYGLDKDGRHGPGGAMGVPFDKLPRWDSIQVLPAQLHRFPLMDDAPVDASVVIGPDAAKPLKLEIPLLVSDMSFGALSEEAKVALARGADAAGTGICSGEGGMLPEEQESNSRYLFEIGPAEFGYSLDLMRKVQAFHFKTGQGAKTGTGGHLPGPKNRGKIAEVRGTTPGETVISPPRIARFSSLDDYKALADEVRDATGGIPIGVKMSANHIEKEIDAALGIGVDYIIIDGRGGGTGSAPLIFRDHISIPTIPALARARSHLDSCGFPKGGKVTLIVTGGLRVPADFFKALALGAEAIALSNAAIQAVGCVAMRACHTNNCPVGVATQKEELRKRLDIVRSAKRLERFFNASVDLMKVLSRACGHSSFSELSVLDIATFDREIHHLTGIPYAGVGG